MLTDENKERLASIVKAAINGDLRLLECCDKDGDKFTLLCSIKQDGEGLDTEPLAQMFDGIDPFVEFMPPSEEEVFAARNRN